MGILMSKDWESTIITVVMLAQTVYTTSFGLLVCSSIEMVVLILPLRTVALVSTTMISSSSLLLCQSLIANAGGSVGQAAGAKLALQLLRVSLVIVTSTALRLVQGWR